MPQKGSAVLVSMEPRRAEPRAVVELCHWAVTSWAGHVTMQDQLCPCPVSAEILLTWVLCIPCTVRRHKPRCPRQESGTTSLAVGCSHTPVLVYAAEAGSLS